MDENVLKISTYSQAGTILDPALSGLRDQIKKIMIPMLIKIFQFKLDLNQSMSLPSRLQRTEKEAPHETLGELKKLDEDLELLILWCQSCRNQIGKALTLPDEERKEGIHSTSAKTSFNPDVSKSFTEALAAQGERPRPSSLFAQQAPMNEPSQAPKPNWIKKIFTKP